MPASDSARVCAHVAATVAGLIAPARMNGVIITAWFASAYARAAPSIVASQTSGEFALMRLKTTVFSLDEVRAEDDPRHLDRVAGALRMRDGAHERLVARGEGAPRPCRSGACSPGGRPARRRCRRSGGATARRTRASRSCGSPRSSRSAVRRRDRGRTASRRRARRSCSRRRRRRCARGSGRPA